MTWDTFYDLAAALEKLSDSTDCSYVLVMTQKGRENEDGGYRVVAKASAAMGSAGDVLAIDDALADVMSEAEARFGLDDDPPD